MKAVTVNVKGGPSKAPKAAEAKMSPEEQAEVIASKADAEEAQDAAKKSWRKMTEAERGANGISNAIKALERLVVEESDRANLDRIVKGLQALVPMALALKVKAAVKGNGNGAELAKGTVVRIRSKASENYPEEFKGELKVLSQRKALVHVANAKGETGWFPRGVLSAKAPEAPKAEATAS